MIGLHIRGDAAAAPAAAIGAERDMLFHGLADLELRLTIVEPEKDGSRLDRIILVDQDFADASRPDGIERGNSWLDIDVSKTNHTGRTRLGGVRRGASSFRQARPDGLDRCQVLLIIVILMLSGRL